MKPGIDQGIAPIILVPQTLLMPATKEVVADTASGGTCMNRTPRHIIRTGVDGITPGHIHNTVIVIEPSSLVLIVIVGNSPPCGLNRIQEVGNKRRSISPDLVGQSQKLDVFIDGKLPNDLDLTYIFSKVFSHKLSDGSSWYLYTRCRMNFVADTVQTQTPQFMDLRFSTINALDENSGLVTPATRIRRPNNGAHWSAPNHVSGETIVVRVSEAKSGYEYNYKTEIQIWK